MGNLTVSHAGLTFPLRKPKIGLKAHFYKFSVTEVPIGGVSDIGKEVDFIASLKQSNSISADLSYAIFTPGEAVGLNASNITRLGFNLDAKF